MCLEVDKKVKVAFKASLLKVCFLAMATPLSTSSLYPNTNTNVNTDTHTKGNLRTLISSCNTAVSPVHINSDLSVYLRHIYIF